MKLLRLVENVCHWHRNVSLKNICVVGVQHLVSTTLKMFLSLIKQGLPPQNVFLMGKCYSTNPFVFEEFKHQGIVVGSDSLYFQSHESYDITFREVLGQFIEQQLPAILARNPEKIIVLDDGGMLLDLLQKQQIKCPLIGIEQTTSGFRWLKKSKLKIPIINLARSRTKLFHESPLIAQTSIKTMLKHLSRLPLSIKRILLIGKGAIGKAMCRELHRQGFTDTVFYDIQASKSNLSAHVLKESLNQFDLVVGCTGSTSIGTDLHQFLKKNAVLVSLSSSDREFEAVALRKSLQPIFNCHEHIYSNNVYLLNCGFPIDFDDLFETLDSEEYQLTRSLLAQAIYQACAMPKRPSINFYPLNAIMQKKILIDYKRYHPQSSILTT